MGYFFHSWPPAIFRRWLSTLILGCACLLVGLVAGAGFRDGTLLVLSGAVFLFSLLRAALLCRVILRGDYETVQGVCVQISERPLQKCRRVRFLDAEGNEQTLLLGKQARLRIGYRYRFYLKRGGQPIFDNAWLQSSLATDQLLGYEELGEYIEEERPAEKMD